MNCEACKRDEHWLCGLQTWCACDCDPALAPPPDWEPLDPFVAREFGFWDVFDEPPQEDTP